MQLLLDVFSFFQTFFHYQQSHPPIATTPHRHRHRRQEIARKQAIAQLEVIDAESPASQESDLILCEMIQNHFVARRTATAVPG